MKMGKSLGNTLEPNDLVKRFGSDGVRYFFLREVEFGGDGDYSEDRFINIVNAHLANTIGTSTFLLPQQQLDIAILFGVKSKTEVGCICFTFIGRKSS